MKAKFLNILLIIFSLFGYLECGKDNKSFLFQEEYEVLCKLFSNSESVIHPFIIIPLLGQILLLVTLFQKRPGKILTYISIACLGLLLGFMFFIGILGMRFKILISTIPFLVTSIYTLTLSKSRLKRTNQT